MGYGGVVWIVNGSSRGRGMVVLMRYNIAALPTYALPLHAASLKHHMFCLCSCKVTCASRFMGIRKEGE